MQAELDKLLEQLDVDAKAMVSTGGGVYFAEPKFKRFKQISVESEELDDHSSSHSSSDSSSSDSDSDSECKDQNAKVGSLESAIVSLESAIVTLNVENLDLKKTIADQTVTIEILHTAMERHKQDRWEVPLTPWSGDVIDL